MTTTKKATTDAIQLHTIEISVVNVYCCISIHSVRHCPRDIIIDAITLFRNWCSRRDVCLLLINIDFHIWRLLYEPYANVSSQICPFLALRPQFHSNPSVNLSTPRYCQSATFGRLTFCVYPLLFLRNSRLMSPRPPRARHAHRANRSAAR